MVDILGCLLHVQVHAANIYGTKAADEVMFRAADSYPSLKAFSGDAGYRSSAVTYAQEQLGRTLYISEKIKGEFAVLPKRWVVERTFAWLGKFRRLAKDYEILTASAENMVRITMLKITLAKCT